MKKTNLIFVAVLTLGLGTWGLGFGILFAQNVGINTTGATPNSRAILDIDANGAGLGLLIPRMTTAVRDTIGTSGPAIPEGLMIYNTTTKCFEVFNITWQNMFCTCTAAPTGVTASASPNPICAGSTLTLTGGATAATSWSWTGPNAFTSTLQSPTIASITTAGAGVYTLTASNTCGSATAVNTASVTVNTIPTGVTASASPNPICAGSTLTLTGGATGATSWSWTGPNAFTSTLQSPTIASITTAGAGVYTLTASNSGCPANPVNTASVTVTNCTTFVCTAAQETWQVPSGVTSITIEALGAQGENIQGIAGGLGGEAVATVPVTPLENLYINVGCAGSGSVGGFNGGGNGNTGGYNGGGGGGASDVRQGGTLLTNRIIVGGGGGGAGGRTLDGNYYAGGTGGNGGNTNGNNGGNGNGSPTYGRGGGGGNQTVGGNGGAGGCCGCCGTGVAGSNGVIGTGGIGGSASNGVAGGGGGGGGGYYAGGGGGGGGKDDTEDAGGGGGGGSGYTPTGTGMVSGVQSGNGQITISW